MSGSQTALNVSDNIIKLPSSKTSYKMLRINWEINDFTLKNNEFLNCNPGENYILDSTTAVICGFVDINNNNGIVPKNNITGNLSNEKYYNNGDILIDYKGSETRSYVGKVCVKDGLYVSTAWQPNKAYVGGDIFYNDDYKKYLRQSESIKNNILSCLHGGFY